MGTVVNASRLRDREGATATDGGHVARALQCVNLVGEGVKDGKSAGTLWVKWTVYIVSEGVDCTDRNSDRL